ncbi:MAG: hypothetical protein AAGA58_13880 [Verrucomicrobiota bacterium]
MSAETIQFSCNACGVSLTVPAHLAGVKGPCPQCGAEIQAPAMAAEPQPVANLFTGEEQAIPASAVPPPQVPSQAPPQPPPAVAPAAAPASVSATMLESPAAAPSGLAEFPELPPVQSSAPATVAPQPREVPAHVSPPAAPANPSSANHPGVPNSVVVPSVQGPGAEAQGAGAVSSAPVPAAASDAGGGLASLLSNAQHERNAAVEVEPKRRRKGKRRVKAEPEKPGRLRDQPRRGPDRPYKSIESPQFSSEQGEAQESGQGGGGSLGGGRATADLSPRAEPARKGGKALLALAALIIIGGFVAAGYFLWPKFMEGKDALAGANASDSSSRPFIIAKNPDGTAADGSNPPEPATGETAEPVIDPVVAKVTSDPPKPEPSAGSASGPTGENSPESAPPRPDMAQNDAPGPNEVVPRPANPVSSNNPVPPPVPANADHAAAQRALEAFLNATTMDDRYRFVHAPEKIEKEMEAYYGRHPQGIEPTRVDFQLSNKLRDSEYNFHVFEVTTRQQPDPFPVSVEETVDGHKIDWRLFIEFHDNLLGRFTKIFQERPEQFRVMLERAHYFRNDIPEVGNKLCFRIRPPMLGYEGYCFVTADSSLGKELESKFDWDVLYMPIVELQWVEVDGWKFIKLTKVIQDNWRTAF